MATTPKPLAMPKSVDEHAVEYLGLKNVLDEATAQLKAKKAEILKLVTRNGQVPEGAEKSLRLEGDQYSITASFGTSSSVDAEVVGEIKSCLASRPSVFRKLFVAHTSYIVSPQSGNVLATCSAKVRKLFERVVETKPKEPSLKVEKKKK